MSITQQVEWKTHYGMVLKRMFGETYKSTIQNNRDTYSKAFEKITRPCDKCGHNNKYEHCESCLYAEFVGKTNKTHIESYIARHVRELTEFIQVKAVKDAHRKALTSKISELKGKPVKEAKNKESNNDEDEDNSGGSRSSRKRTAPESSTEEPIQIDAGVKKVNRLTS